MSEAETDEAWTISRLVAWAAADFKKRDIPSPRLEAEILLAAILKVDRVRLILDAARPLSDDELSAYKAAFVRRRKGEPLAYIVGKREFFGRDFHVDKRVLVPRPDTEVLLELALEKTSHRDLQGRALDLCTGSGCVATSFALARKTWAVTGTDLSEGALEVARANAIRLGAMWGLRWVAGDLFAAIDENEKFEVILSNPPYIPAEEVLTLEPTVKDFEPRSALDGGATGLDFYPRLAEGARRHLVPGGLLAVEVGAGQAAEVEKIFSDAGFERLERRTDLGGHERVVAGHAPRR